ncbi:MAG: YeeE/YedE family protein [Sedimentisphaerales bacterium]|nr:YeeE/YedE family protein [Sedimentisphaerales bacterium]
MSATTISFIIGILFGAALYLGGLANPDKIVGTLRLKDFHAMRTIAVFVLVGMLGTWILQLIGHANMDVKPAEVLPVLIGGALLGIGFGLTGYCPGTGLACVAAGRFDALITVIGMFFGALAYIYIIPTISKPLASVMNYDKTTLPEKTGINAAVFVIPLVVIGVLLLWLTRPGSKSTTVKPI